MRWLCALGMMLAASSVEAGVPPKLGTDEAVIFCATAGCKVTAVFESGKTRRLAAGTRVKYVSEDGGAGGDGSAVHATIEIGGRRATVPNTSVITESRLERAPGGKAAVFSASASCGDVCETTVWLIAGDRSVLLKGANAHGIAAAWSPDGKQVAVGSWVLHIVDLESLRTKVIESVSAPAYAPDGVLFARVNQGGAVVTIDAKLATHRLGAPPKGKPPEDDDEPLAPVRFEDGGNVVVATFRRGQREVVMRYPRH